VNWSRLAVSEVSGPGEDAEEANLQLDKGLLTCRTVVNNYRALLSSTDCLPTAQFRGSRTDSPPEDPTPD
jgi:hypothetical protein